MKLPPDEAPELANLVSLGFGPDAALMTEPRLFVDERLLGALIVELDDELGPELASRTLFQIGLIHGLRDADRVVAAGFLSGGAGGGNGAELSSTASGLPAQTFGAPGWTSLLLDLCAPLSDVHGLEISGRWPEHHEASAWLAKLGPGEKPTCWLSCGYTSGWLSATLDADLIALEAACAVRGEPSCHFVAREPAAWAQLADAAAAAQLAEIGPIDMNVYRALALRCPSGPPPEMIESEGAFDPDAALVHIWGPVMVLPYTGADEVLRTTEALSRDPGTADIGAVVLDLRDAAIDEGFGAAAVERVLETIETWGAEPILTGVGPLAEAAIASMETRHLLVRKDLSGAIAAAFQIAEAQRYVA